MQSRGIKREQAVALLKKGFCMQIINSMPALARSWDLLKQSL
jgi:Fe-S cluster assembly scaffold protein SufB